MAWVRFPLTQVYHLSAGIAVAPAGTSRPRRPPSCVLSRVRVSRRNTVHETQRIRAVPRRMEEQLRVDIEILQASYRHQVGAVELIGRKINGESSPPPYPLFPATPAGPCAEEPGISTGTSARRCRGCPSPFPAEGRRPRVARKPVESPPPKLETPPSAFTAPGNVRETQRALPERRRNAGVVRGCVSGTLRNVPAPLPLWVGTIPLQFGTRDLRVETLGPEGERLHREGWRSNLEGGRFNPTGERPKLGGERPKLAGEHPRREG